MRDEAPKSLINITSCTVSIQSGLNPPLAAVTPLLLLPLLQPAVAPTRAIPNKGRPAEPGRAGSGRPAGVGPAPADRDTVLHTHQRRPVRAPSSPVRRREAGNFSTSTLRHTPPKRQVRAPSSPEGRREAGTFSHYSI